MKAKILLPILLSSFAFTSTAADDYSGHRIGVGISDTITFYDSDLYYGDTGLHLEYGYDINRIVGLNVMRDTSDLTRGIRKWDSQSTESITWKVGADIGYAFDFSGWDLKPYGALGVQHSSTAITYENSGSDDYNNTTPYIGFGVRANLDMGIYFDITASGFYVKDPDWVDIGQSSLTIGYKF